MWQEPIKDDSFHHCIEEPDFVEVSSILWFLPRIHGEIPPESAFFLKLKKENFTRKK